MQFQADLSGIAVARAAATETTALGAAGIAGIGCGFWDRESFARVVGTDRTFLPSGDRPAFDRRYAAWREAVRRSLGWADVSDGRRSDTE